MITPEMVEAGVGAYLSHRQDSSTSDLVMAIYLVMRNLERIDQEREETYDG